MEEYFCHGARYIGYKVTELPEYLVTYTNNAGSQVPSPRARMADMSLL